MSSIHVSLGEVAAALVLAALAVAVSIAKRASLEGDIGLAAARAFVQLSAVGYVVKVVFEQDRLVFVIVLLAAMTIVGAFTARRRATSVPRAFWPLFVALASAAAATLGLVVALGVFAAEPRYLVPVGGMVIGNAMTAAAVALNRLGDDVRTETPRIEATLALGAPARDALRPVVRRSLRSGLIPLIDSTKTTGLVFFPGTMVGMLLAGAAPVDAVRLQLGLLYALLGAVALATLTAVALAQRAFITAAHQLREHDTTSAAHQKLSPSAGSRRLIRRSGKYVADAYVPIWGRRRMASSDRGFGGITLGGIIVIVGIVVMIIWSFWIGLIIALIGLIAFGGFARGKWY